MNDLDDAADYLIDQQRAASASVVSEENDDPDRAAWAISLSHDTGVPPTAIYHDQPTFERNHKAALTQSLLKSNSFLQDFANFHPLAPKVAADDWPQLDLVSEKVQQLSGMPDVPDSFGSVAGAVFKGFQEGWGKQPLHEGAADFVSYLAKAEIAGQTPFSGFASGPFRLATFAAAGAFEDMLRAIQGGFYGVAAGGSELARQLGGSETTAEQLRRDILGITQVGLAGQGGVSFGFKPVSIARHAAIVERMGEVAKEIAADRAAEWRLARIQIYAKGGREPPVGIDPAIDRLKGEQAQADAKSLDDALREANASATRERSPELFAAFVRQHTQGEIGISAEAIRKLYGDEQPAPDDGKLGWVPDIANKLAIAEQTGGDVSVPLADWLARVEPDIARDLHDHIRVRRGGMTVEEARETPEAAIARVESQPDSPERLAERHRFDEDILHEEWVREDNAGRGDEPLAQALRAVSAGMFSPTELPKAIKWAKENGRDDIVRAGLRLWARWNADRKAFYAADTGEGLPPEAAERLKAKMADRLAGFEQGLRETEQAAGITAEEAQAVTPRAGGMRPAVEPLAQRPNIEIQRVEKQPNDGTHDFELLIDGALRGNLRVTEEQGGKHLYVDDIQSGRGPGSIGPAVKDILDQLRNQFPQAETISGLRVSGAREAAGRGPEEVTLPLRRPLTEMEGAISALRQEAGISQNLVDMIEAAKRRLAGEFEYTFDDQFDVTARLRPTELFTSREQQIFDRVNETLDRILGPNPFVETTAVHGIRHGQYQPTGIFLQYPDHVPIILWSLRSDNPLRTARHEALHFLRQYGLFTEREWQTLVRQAVEENWIQKHNIDKRYPDLELKSQLEEAIADEFAKWRERPDSPEMQAAPHKAAKQFSLLKQALDAIREAITRVLGFEPTADHLFVMAETGEIGKRQPKPIHETSFRPPKIPEGFKPEDYVAPRMEGPGPLAEEPPAGPEPFEKAAAAGMTVVQYKRYLRKIAQSDAEDIAKQTEAAAKDIRRRQKAEWKEAETKVRDEVEKDIAQRPDWAADRFLRDGVLWDEKLPSKPKLDGSRLTAEQKAALPPEVVGATGLHPDDMAGLFGYSSGEAMVNRLGIMEQARKASGLKPEEFRRRQVQIETARRMQREHGDLEENVLKEAEEHVLGPTQMDMLHDQTLGLGMKAGSEFPIKKGEIEAWAKEQFDRTPIKGQKPEKFIADMGRAGRAVEEALLKDDFKEAFKQSQRQYIAALMAKQAKALEKEQARFDRNAKRFSARVVEGFPQEYTNFIHDILTRVGSDPMVRRSQQDLQTEIGASGFADLRAFVDSKLADGREMPVPDFLFDPAFRKKLDELTAGEFTEVSRAITSMIKNGRDEGKIIKGGNEFDLDTVKDSLVDQLTTLSEREVSPTVQAKKGWRYGWNTVLASMLQVEALFNRWDRADPNGPWTQYVIRPLAEASNYVAKLEREFSHDLRGLGDKTDLNRKVDNNLFINPFSVRQLPNGRPDWTDTTGTPMQMTHGTVRAILQNVGNRGNLEKLARGYGLEPDAVMQWLFTKTTKADWDWAQKQGGVFAKIKGLADTMYRELSGVAPESIDIQPIQTPFGEYAGWYHPIVYSPEYAGTSKALAGKGLFDEEYTRATTPQGYTKARTGYIAPLSLYLDQTPSLMRGMLHDIAYRPAVINASKVLYDARIKNTITKHYGIEYSRLMEPFLRDVANSANFRSDVQAWGTQVGEFMRQNIIGTLIGFNPGTVLKHTQTAAVNSMTEVGLGNFAKAFKDLWSESPDKAQNNWNFALENSEELARRHRNYIETMRGAHAEATLGKSSMREAMIYYGAKPVAFFDLASAVPTWLAEYRTQLEGGASVGDATFIADRAVRRAHGSVVVTNRPAVMRGGAMAQWMTSLYGFFSHMWNRQYELMWKAGDAISGLKKGDLTDFKAYGGDVGRGVFSYVILPAIIEELVSPLTNEQHESWGKWAAKAIAKGVSSSWPVVRDLAHFVLSGGSHEPSVGMFSATAKATTDFLKDIPKGREAFNKAHAGATLQHAVTVFGAFTGLTNQQEGRWARAMYDYATGQAKPKNAPEWWQLFRKGKIDRQAAPDEVERLLGRRR